MLSLPELKAAVGSRFLTALEYAWLSGFAWPAQRTCKGGAWLRLRCGSGRMKLGVGRVVRRAFVVAVIDRGAGLDPGFWLFVRRGRADNV